MNDPNGLIQWGGEYHLFYQHHPFGTDWGPMHWGHAVSADLVRWRHLPIALAPSPGGPDAGGVFSGSAVDDGGVLGLVYTGHGERQVQCLATSRDGRVFAKDPANPVLAAPPEGFSTADFRDPKAWRAEGKWWLVAGTRVWGRRGDRGPARGEVLGPGPPQCRERPNRTHQGKRGVDALGGWGCRSPVWRVDKRYLGR